MTATVVGPYEHTGVYRPDVVAQAEGIEPQWSDVPVVPAPDLTGMPLPSLRDFALAIAEEITTDASVQMSNTGRALSFAAAMTAHEVRDLPALGDADVLSRHYREERFDVSRQAWRDLRVMRAIQLDGWDGSRALFDQWAAAAKLGGA